MKTLNFTSVIFLLMALVFLSCTNPGLKKPSEEVKNPADNDDRKETSALAVHQDNAERSPYDTVSGEFDLEKVSSSPLEVIDSMENVEDMSVAVDDYIWRELSRAQDFYAMGVIANRETAWEEAQYYFEKGLEILAELDIDSDADSLSPEAAKYNILLADIFTNYRVTLLSLGHLPGDISPDALMARFSEVNHIRIDSSEFKKIEDYAAEKISYNVPIILNERVKKSILYYQTVARDPVQKYLSRSTRFIPMIDSIFREMDVPTDIKYLALVESGYSPYAYSRARASGLWQFIASTGRLYGLKRSWWYDERRDPIKATIAAARFLKDLYDEFGSWELAMAAYNGGPGRVRRQIKRQKTRDFWKLDLRKQTEDYVPFFMAATMISKNPENFGFSDIEYQPEWKYEVVEIDKCLDLKTIAGAIGCTVKDLKDLNPELLRRFTPPNMNNYNLRIPVGSGEKFWAAYESMPTSKETSFVRHMIRKGETVSTIARKYGVSQYAIFEANNLSRRSKIYAGKSLIVPVPNDQAYSRRTKSDYKADGNIYVVRSGDTVWDIARAFGTSAEKIRRLNNLDRWSRIYVGQKLVIGEGKTKSTSSKSYAENTDRQTDSGGRYTVRKGDTLWDIAKKFGTSISNVKKLNGLERSSRIYPGQKLIVPNNKTAESYEIYTVRSGDTIYEIAESFNVSAQRLMAWNGVTNPRRLAVGQRLKIYTN